MKRIFATVLVILVMGRCGKSPPETLVTSGYDEKEMDASDWMFMRGGKIHGNHTMRPLLKTMPKREADQYRSMLADPGP